MRSVAGPLALGLFAVLWLGASCARLQGAAPAPESAVESVSVPLLADLGEHRRPISTSSPEAQRFFDQGLALTYGFHHELAVRSFREAARLDPACAMCSWGEALALGPNINAPMGPDAAAEAWDALQAARTRAGGASAVERALIEALGARYAPDGDPATREERDRAYAEAMREVHRAHPLDDDVATLFAESLMNLNPWNHWTADGEPAPETPEIVATLERVLARAPDHPGANHLYIHAIEASQTPERAEAAADRLATLVPGSGHLVHMPSHIYLRIGRYEDAVALNKLAAQVDEALFAWCRTQGIYRAAYYPHNIHFIWTAALFEGRSELALTTARRLSAAVPDEMVRALPMIEEFRAVPYVTFARFGRWDTLLGEPAPPEDFRYVTGIRHYARALAHLRRGELSQLESEAAALEAVASEPALLDLAFPGGTAATLLRLASLHLAGERAFAAGDVAGAIAALAEAVALQDGLPYTEPPPFYLPVRQALGAVLLEAGRSAEAEAVYLEDLRNHPKNGWSLLGLSQSLAAQNEAARAEAAAEGFRRAWARADVELPASRF